MAPGFPRDPRKAEQWRARLQRWQRAGQSIRAFCIAHGFSEPSFYAWRRGLARPAPSGPAFLPVHVGKTRDNRGPLVVPSMRP